MVAGLRYLPNKTRFLRSFFCAAEHGRCDGGPGFVWITGPRALELFPFKKMLKSHLFLSIMSFESRT